MDKVPMSKWEWSVSTPLNEATPDQIWPLLVDFFNIHKWCPILHTCHGIHGNNGDVGCIRHCYGSSIPSVDGAMSWAKEKLTVVDPTERLITYEVVDCNIGFKSYVATIKICPGSGDGECVIWWFVAVDPIQGRVKEDMVAQYVDILKVMVKNMESYALGRFGELSFF